MKAIAVLRVSTEGQQIDDQRDELFEFIRSQGYDEIIPIEAVGASAIKMDDKYLYMVQKIKDIISQDKDIDSVFVWELSRLGRNEMILMEFKDLFIKNHIQFICKNPFMKLLNDDGSVNAGMELAFSLFATMSKQEMEEKKSRFKRAKKYMSAKGKYLGGNTVKYGYKVVDGFFQVDEVEGEVVKTVFDMYSTGKHSSYTLAKELQEQGIEIPEFKVCNILRCRAYLGEEVSESGMHYPQIISRELFDRCEEIRQGNKIMMKRGSRICLGAKLIKCPVCGATCTSNSKHYRCSKNSHMGKCDNKFALNQSVADELLWRTTYPLHLDYLMKASEGKLKEYKKELKTVEEKIAACDKKIANFIRKKQRIIDTYLDGLINKENRDLRLSKLEDDIRFQTDYQIQLQGKREAIERLLETSSVDTYESFLSSFDVIEAEDKYDLVHKWIESLVAVRESFGKKNKKSKKPNGVHITIKSIYGQVFQYMYIPQDKKGSNLFVWNGAEWVADRLG